MKTCANCHETQSDDRFYSDTSRQGGLARVCKTCDSERKKAMYQANRRAILERVSSYQKSEVGKEVHRRASENYWNKHPERKAAHNAVTLEVVTGRMPAARTQVCANCGQSASEYHHHLGYSDRNWLDVIPLCSACHKD